MKITNTMCYTHLAWLLRQGEFLRSVSNVSFSQPAVEFEGMAGYIETKVEFDVKDIVLFAKVYIDYYSVDNDYKMKIRAEIVNNTCS